MRSKFCLGMILVIMMATSVQASSEGSGNVVAFVDVNLLPMDREAVVPGQTVLVRGDRIAVIGPSGSVEVPEGAQRIEGRGRYLMPGLAEMHAHIPPAQAGENYVEQVLYLWLANGITTVRGMLGEASHLELREKVARGEVLGPNIYTSGPSLNGNTVQTVEEAKRSIVEQKKAGYDFLKLHPGLTREVFDAIAETAHELDIPFAGHVSRDVGLAHTLETGQASIDHLDGYMETLVADGAPVGDLAPMFFGFHLVDHLDESKIAPIAAKTRAVGAWVVPTESLMEDIASPEEPDRIVQRPEMAYMPERTVQQWVQRKRAFLELPIYNPERARRFIEVRRKLIKGLHDAGVGMLLGSDSPQVFNVPGFSLRDEMRMLQETGLTPYEILTTGTRNVAVYFGDEGEFGTVEEGKRADLILLEANPLEDVANVARRAGVMVRGRWLPEEEIQNGLKDIAAAHAKPGR